MRKVYYMVCMLAALSVIISCEDFLDKMPVDLVSLVDHIPNAETVIYNQVVFIPGQKRELAQLDKKKNRHASIPTPSNQMAVEDIRRVQEVVCLLYTSDAADE